VGDDKFSCSGSRVNEWKIKIKNEEITNDNKLKKKEK